MSTGTGDLGSETLKFSIEGNAAEVFDHYNRTLPTLSNNLQTLIRQFAQLDEVFSKQVKGLDKQSIDDLAQQMKLIQKRLDVLDNGTKLRGQMAGAFTRANETSGRAYEESAVARERKKVLKAESDKLYNDVFSGVSDTQKTRLSDLSKEELAIRKQAHRNAMVFAQQAHNEELNQKHKRSLELLEVEEKARAKALSDQKKAEKALTRQEAQEAAEARAKANRLARQQEYLATPAGHMQAIRERERARFLGEQGADSVVRLNERERLVRMKAKAGNFKSVQDMILNESYGETYSESDLKTADKGTLKLREREIKRQMEAAGLVESQGLLHGNRDQIRKGESAIRALQMELETIKAIQTERKRSIHTIRENFEWGVKQHTAGQSLLGDEKRLLEIKKQLADANRLYNEAQANGDEEQQQELTKIIALLKRQRGEINQINADRQKYKNNDRASRNFDFDVQAVDLTQKQSELLKEQHKIRQRLAQANKQLSNAEMIQDEAKAKKIHETIAALKEQQRLVQETLSSNNAYNKAKKQYEDSKADFDRTVSTSDIKAMKENELLREKVAMNERLQAIKRQLKQATKFDSEEEQQELRELIDLTQERIRAIREQEQAQRTSDHWANRTSQIISAEGSGSLLLIQSQLATNYAILNGITQLAQSGYQYLKDFEIALLQTQAISQATTTQMVDLKNSIFDVSESTKFTSIELAQATTVLAQAGFSLKEIQSSLGSVALLATATGSSLENAVDIATSVLGAFQMSAGKLPTVVNQITQAMNLSKLDVEKFQLAIQYAGNAAADAGLTFKETLAVVATVANTGVRSGSTLGTGFRQLINDLKDPSEDFLDTLTKLGLGLDSINIRVHGLSGVVENLKNAGFTTSDAFKSFEVRAVTFFTSLSNNLNLYESLDKQMNSTTAAAEANAIQMKSLDAQLKRTSNQFMVLIYEGLEPTIDSFTQLLKLTGSLLAVMRTGSPDWVKAGVQYSVMAAGATLFAGGLLLVISRLRAAGAALMTFWRTSLGASAATMTNLQVLRAAAGGWAFLAAAIFGGMIALEQSGNRMDALNTKLEQTKTAFSEMRDTLAETETQLKEVDNKIYNLNARFEKLKENPELVGRELEDAREMFNKFGVSVEQGATNKVEALIKAYQDLRVEIAKELVANVSGLMSALNSLVIAREAMFKEKTGGMQKEGSYKASLLDPQGGLFSVKGYGFYGGANNLEELVGAREKSLPILYDNMVNAAKRRGFDSAQFDNLADVITNLDKFNTRLSSPDFGLGDNLKSDSDTYNKLAPAMNRLIKDMLKYLDAQVESKKVDAKGMREIASEKKLYTDLLSGIEMGGERLADLRRNEVSYDALTRQEAKATALLRRAEGKPSFLMSEKAQRIEEKVGVWKIAQKYGVPYDLVMAVMDQESKFKIKVRSPAGAEGLMQLMPATQKRFGVTNPYNPDQNVEAGVKYLAFLLKRFKGDENLALAGYNAGESNVDKYKGIPPFKETQNYVREVQRKRKSYLGAPDPVFKSSSGIDTDEFYFEPMQTSDKVEKLRKKRAKQDVERDRLVAALKTLKKGSEKEIKISGELQVIEDEIVTTQEALRDSAESFNVAETKLLEKRKKQAKLDVQYLDREIQDYQRLLVEYTKAGELQKAEDMRQKYLKARKAKYEAEVKQVKVDNTVISAQDSAYLMNKKDVDFAVSGLKRDLERDILGIAEGRTLAEKDRITAAADAEFKALIKDYKDGLKRERQEFARLYGEEKSYLAALNKDSATLLKLQAEKKKLEKEKAFITEEAKKGKYSSFDVKAKEEQIQKVEDSIRAEEYALALKRKKLTDLKTKDVEAQLEKLKIQVAKRLAEVDKMEALVESGDASTEMLTIQRDELNNLQNRVNQLEGLLEKLRESGNKSAATIDANDPSKGDVKPMTTRQIAAAWSKETLDNLNSYETKLRRITDIADQTSKSMAQMFTEIMDGSKDAADAVEDFGKRFLGMIVEMAMQEAALRMVSGLVGLFGGSASKTPATTGALNIQTPDLGLAVPKGFARGGEVIGSKLGYDSVPAILKPKEYVLPTETTNLLGKDFLDGLRMSPKATLDNLKGKGSGDILESVVNVYMVTPENKPQSLSKNDIIMTITDDLQRNGQVMQTIKNRIGGR